MEPTDFVKQLTDLVTSLVESNNDLRDKLNEQLNKIEEKLHNLDKEVVSLSIGHGDIKDDVDKLRTAIEALHEAKENINEALSQTLSVEDIRAIRISIGALEAYINKDIGRKEAKKEIREKEIKEKILDNLATIVKLLTVGAAGGGVVKLISTFIG